MSVTLYLFYNNYTIPAISYFCQLLCSSSVKFKRRNNHRL